MFSSARAFNQDVSGWSISSATDMDDMFYDASMFDQDLCQWVDVVKNVPHENFCWVGPVSCSGDSCGAFPGEVCTVNSDCNADLSLTCFENVYGAKWCNPVPTYDPIPNDGTNPFDSTLKRLVNSYCDDGALSADDEATYG